MPTWDLTPVCPRSVGAAFPDRIVTNEEVCVGLDTTPQWIEERTGVRERRFLAVGQSITDLAVRAADDALDADGLDPQHVDVLIVACTAPDWSFPSMALQVATRLGIPNARIIDLTQYACSSAVFATHMAACVLQEPALSTALVVCAEGSSRHLEPTDRTTRVFFGDAATAVVLRTAEAGTGLRSFDMGSSYSDAVSMAGTGQLALEREESGVEHHTRFLNHQPQAVLREVLLRLPRSINCTLEDAGLTTNSIDAWAFHQASVRLVQQLTHAMKIDPSRVAVTADRFGNTGAASPFTALWQLALDGHAKKGANIMLAAIGAGFLWGSMCFTLSDDIRVKG